MSPPTSESPAETLPLDKSKAARREAAQVIVARRLGDLVWSAAIRKVTDGWVGNTRSRIMRTYNIAVVNHCGELEIDPGHDCGDLQADCEKLLEDNRESIDRLAQHLLLRESAHATQLDLALDRQDQEVSNA